MNDSHMRRHVSKGPSPQPVGTTSNEALHVELRAAFRHVYDMHGPVMRLKLNCFVLSKQVVLEGALRAAGLRQRRPDHLLARLLSRPPLEEDARERWCAHFLLQGDTAAAHGSQGRRCQNASMESWSLLGEEEDQGNQENADHSCQAGSSDVGWRSLALSTAA